MRSISHALSLAAALLTGSVHPVAQQPQVVPPQILHAQVSTQSVNGDLSATLEQLKQSATPLWAAYAIPTARPFTSHWDSQTAYLEGQNSADNQSRDENTPAQGRAVVLLRLAGGKVDKIRVEDADRAIDAGGLRFVWLAGVTPEASVAVLKTLCQAATTDRQISSAVFLISLHQTPAAVPALVALAAPGGSLHQRDQAAFWLSSGRGHEGFLALQTLARNDKDEEFRRKLVFDISQSKDAAALDELVRLAHDDASPRVRIQAQFWMASRGGKLVAASLRDSADNDPEASVRKQAVFAVSRLPKAEAATQLVQLAETSKYPEVRKQAVFWLGQSSDPRALEYLTRLLTTPKAN